MNQASYRKYLKAHFLNQLDLITRFIAVGPIAYVLL